MFSSRRKVSICGESGALYLVVFHKESPAHLVGGLETAAQFVGDVPFCEVARDTAARKTDVLFSAYPELRSLLSPFDRQPRCLPH
jgi:hypothetical protein